METIIKPDKSIMRIWGKPKTNNANYRLLKYVIKTECDAGLLLYNVVTGELLFLDSSEKQIIDVLPSSYDNSLDTLIEKHFLVEESYDEKSAVCNLRKIMRVMDKNDSITGYTILPTTFCNARCFYCYETDFKHVHMSPETADVVADYIIKHSKGKKVQIQWFGGEPTLGNKIISQISNKLRNNGIEYESRMISNGYLFDEEMAKSAKELWNVKKIQITLDGTEDIYNRVKAYVNPCKSPFMKVFNNIRLLLETGINVQVRINLDKHNEDDVEKLLRLLADNFANYDGFQAYVHILFDNQGFEPVIHDEQLKQRLLQKETDMNKFLQMNNIYKKDNGLPKLRYSYCMADRDQSVVIHPTGDIVKCEHSSAEESVGTIFDEVIDKSKASEWKQYIEFDKCNDCVLYPNCILIKKCYLSAECSDIITMGKLNSIENKLHKIYFNYKKNKGEVNL